MAAINPQGGQQYWNNGFPFEGISNANDQGGQQFWFNGLPGEYVFPPTAPASLVKIMSGVAYASVKTVAGIAMASAKKISGIANT